ncbi:hypothetical protein [Campylobacter jejuni]|uniref:hypothetical protein n=1 Tax=Campylobacter jejuni TaxID=197 RepID=UPI001930EDCF|nr:hypothetical protein [Campylobacter jejuni]
MDKNVSLNEKVESYIKDSKYAALNESEAVLMSTLLSNTALASQGALVGESVISSDIAQFTPILMPIVRRVYPALVANQLLGIQPLTMPTGYIYALVNRYTGNKKDGAISPVSKAQILVFEANVTKGDTVTGTTSSATGKIIHVEKDGKTALVQLTNGNKFQNEAADKGTKIVNVYSNEATFHKILETYSGPYSTADGEKLAEDMNTVGFGIEKDTVEAKTRKLKAEYTLEMYEDLKNQHGVLADEHLANLIAAEMQTEIDREIINFVNNTATVVADTLSPGAEHKEAGRWEIERYRCNAIKIDLEARNIGLMTRRGSGNTLLVSPKVATMLDQIGTFKFASSSSNIATDVFTGNVGTYDGRYNVIVDQYAKSDYITVLYKGTTAQDSLGFFCPYVPLSFQKVMNQESGQPGMIARTRYGLATNPLEPENYARTFGVDLTGTILA